MLISLLSEAYFPSLFPSFPARFTIARAPAPCPNQKKHLRRREVNEHESILGEGLGEGKCGHGIQSEEEGTNPWLAKSSPAQNALRQIVLKKRFFNEIQYYTHFWLVLDDGPPRWHSEN